MTILINKPSDLVTLTIKNSNGLTKLDIAQKSNIVLKNIFGQGPRGIQGETGPAGKHIVSLVRTSGTGAPGTSDTYTITYNDSTTQTFTIYNGEDGVDGRGITSIVRTTGTGAPGTTDTYTITYTDATTSTFNVYNGADGRSVVSITRTTGTGAPGTTDIYTITYSDATTSTFNVYNGIDGADGRSVVSIARTSGTGAAGTVDTYTITYSDATTSTFTITNGADGRGITNIARTTGTGAPGTTDVYTITYTDATTSTFNVYNGADGATGPQGVSIVSIVRTSGTGAPGTTDTYTITYSNSTTSTFNVYNGADGTGIGDMTKAVYDTDNDGIVDAAESVPWSGVSSKPTTLTGYGITDALPSTNPSITGSITEDVYEITGTAPALDPGNGTIQYWTLTANSTPTDSLTTGQGILLMIDDGSGFSITWPTISWLTTTGTPPTLRTTGYNVVIIWKVGTVLYGTYGT